MTRGGRYVACTRQDSYVCYVKTLVPGSSAQLSVVDVNDTLVRVDRRAITNVDDVCLYVMIYIIVYDHPYNQCSRAGANFSKHHHKKQSEPTLSSGYMCDKPADFIKGDGTGSVVCQRVSPPPFFPSCCYSFTSTTAQKLTLKTQVRASRVSPHRSFFLIALLVLTLKVQADKLRCEPC
jgi:hypothetical protein